MPYAIYVAKRELAPGHVLGGTYTILLPALIRNEIGRDLRVEQQRSLSGATESRHYYGKTTWRVQLEPIPGREAANVLEFLCSTEDGQIFDFDPEGYPDSPSPDRASVVRTPEAHQTERAAQRGEGGSSDPFRYSFGIRRV